MKLLSKALFILSACVLLQGCATSNEAVRTYEEDTTRTISSEPRIGEPVRNVP